MNVELFLMRYALTVCALILSGSLSISGQVLATASGSCGVSASGLMSCSWLSTVPLCKTSETTSGRRPPNHPELIVMRFALSPGAPLMRMVDGQDVLIIGMGDGELVNEATSPLVHVSVTNGSVILMPKEQNNLLRNVRKQEVNVQVVYTRR